MFSRFATFVAAAGAAIFVASTFAGGCGSSTTKVAAAGGGGHGGVAAGGSDGTGGTVNECVGVKPDAEAYGRDPGPLLGGVGGAGGASGGMGGMSAGGMGGAGGMPRTLGPTEPGSDAPNYYLDDVHPLSCGYGATYGLPAFKGQVTVAALWAGW